MTGGHHAPPCSTVLPCAVTPLKLLPLVWEVIPMPTSLRGCGREHCWKVCGDEWISLFLCAGSPQDTSVHLFQRILKSSVSERLETRARRHPRVTSGILIPPSSFIHLFSLSLPPFIHSFLLSPLFPPFPLSFLSFTQVFCIPGNCVPAADLEPQVLQVLECRDCRHKPLLLGHMILWIEPGTCACMLDRYCHS